MQQLPFIVGSNPHVKFVYTLYVESFEKLKNFPKIQSESDENGMLYFAVVLCS